MQDRDTDIRQEIDHWLFQTVLPHWFDVAIDHDMGTFIECLHMDGRPNMDAPRRGRVPPRQLFTFGRAHRLGFGDKTAVRRALTRGAETLRTQSYIPHKGFPTLIDKVGHPLSTEHLLYDHAFVALAGAELQALDIEEGRHLSDMAFDLIETRFRDVSTGGYHTAADTPGPKLANPHMHLLEASLLHHAVTGNAGSLDRIAEIATICRHHFILPETGYLAEDRARDFGPSAETWVEPGHCYEWAYLLHCAATLLDDQAVHSSATRLFDVSENFVEADGLVMDKAEARVPTYRLWPQLERLRCLATFDRQALIDPLLHSLQTIYFAHGPDGGWVDKVDADRSPMVDHVPASMLYHLMTAIPVVTRPDAVDAL